MVVKGGVQNCQKQLRLCRIPKIPRTQRRGMKTTRLKYEHVTQSGSEIYFTFISLISHHYSSICTCTYMYIPYCTGQSLGQTLNVRSRSRKQRLISTQNKQTKKGHIRKLTHNKTVSKILLG